MKLKVIGWVDYDDWHFAEGENSLAAHEAILDDIRANGYEFSGWHHQECENGAPVLNDGKIRRYSQRGWGGIMAEAHDRKGMMDYARYAFHFDIDDEKLRMPPPERNARHMIYELAAMHLTEEAYEELFSDGFTLQYPHPELGEHAIYLLTPEEAENLSPIDDVIRQVPYVIYRALVCENLQDTYVLPREACRIGEDHIIVSDHESLRLMGAGDTIVIEDTSFTVRDVEPIRDVPEDIRLAAIFGSFGDKHEEAVKIYESADILLKITLE